MADIIQTQTKLLETRNITSKIKNILDNINIRTAKKWNPSGNPIWNTEFKKRLRK